LEGILNQARAGNEEAFRQLVLATQSRLRGFLAGLVNNGSDVDDMAQEVYVIFYRKLEQTEGYSDPWPFLRTISVNVMRNAWRTESRRCSVVSDRLGEIVAEDAEVQLSELVKVDSSLQAHLEMCLKALPDRFRSVIHMRYWEGQTSTDIADLLGRSASNVRGWLMRARSLLHSCVQGKLSGGTIR
jgi:RNA polymerase sigma-70 factor, ECF subfamily